MTAPTLLVCGSEEVDAAALRSAATRAPRGSYLRLEGYGHLQVFWHADVTGDVMAQWLDAQGWQRGLRRRALTVQSPGCSCGTCSRTWA